MRRLPVCLVTTCLLVAASGSDVTRAQAPAPGGPSRMKAQGTFDVKLTPQDAGEGATLGRMAIDKRFHGDLDGTSTGLMLSAMTGVKGSAGYVAMETVTGVLQGRKGTFVLQHSGTMHRGAPSLTIGVVPDSGTGELTGLSGRMTIAVADGAHSYELDYTIASTP
jgi:hypothetical protein